MTDPTAHLTEMLARIDANIARMTAVLDPALSIAADTITFSRLDDLAALLDACCQTIRRVKLQAFNGDISTEEAAATVRETAETINQFCKS